MQEIVTNRDVIKKWMKRVFAIVAVVIVFFTIETCAYFMNAILPWHRHSAIETTLTWGGLADLPKTADDVSVTTSGSAFTRTFDLSFRASVSDIHQWIEDSPRLFFQTPQEESGGVQIYEVRPGEEGAIGGTVEVRDGITVIIRMSWS